MNGSNNKDNNCINNNENDNNINVKREVEKSQNFKNNIFTLIIIIAIIGLIIPYSGEVILPFFCSKEKIQGIQVWNQFVSMILGVVATIMSIVSLYLCFKSEEKSTIVNHQIEKNLALLSEQVKNLSVKQDHLDDNITSLKMKVDSKEKSGVKAQADDENKL